MRPTAATAIASPLNCSFFFSKGFSGSNRSFHCRKNVKWNSNKAGRSVITAKVDLKPPPYPIDALEPHMSRETLEYHWGKHHRAYVDNLNSEIVGTELDEKTLEEIIAATYNKGDLLPPFDNAAQVWNHDFFWESMKPGGGGKPSGELLRLINRDFGSFEAFVKEFKTAAATQFGSGWAWLVYKANRLNVGNSVNPNPSDEDKKLVVVKSPNTINPLVWDYFPLLAVDVWEHAYYLDFEHRRTDYVSVFMEKLVCWETVEYRLEAAQSRVLEREKEEEKRKRAEDEGVDTANLDEVEMYLESEGDESEAD